MSRGGVEPLLLLLLLLLFLLATSFYLAPYTTFAMNISKASQAPRTPSNALRGLSWEETEKPAHVVELRT